MVNIGRSQRRNAFDECPRRCAPAGRIATLHWVVVDQSVARGCADIDRSAAHSDFHRRTATFGYYRIGADAFQSFEGDVGRGIGRLRAPDDERCRYTLPAWRAIPVTPFRT